MKTKIALGNGKYLCVEKYQASPDFPEELTTYICDEEGNIIQDIALIRPHLDTDNGIDVDGAMVDVFVYADKDNEDYTDKFVVDVLEA